MFYLSERLGAEVLDADGRMIGRLADVVIPPDSDTAAAIVIKTVAKDPEVVPFACLASTGAGGLRVGSPMLACPRHQASMGEMWLARDVLDYQVVDAARARLARVNGIAMEESAEGWRVAAVEVGSRGLLARLGLAGLADALRLERRLIPWQDVGMAQGRTDRLEQMHPAELAAIVHELPPAQGSDLVESLDDELAADTLEEVHPDRQADLLEDMAPERAAEILDEMAPDEAADVLQDMSEEKARELLGLMEDEEAADAKELLAHAEDSAGGLMTTEYAALPPGLTAAGALAELRSRYAGELDHLYYAYVTDGEERVLGVASLWDLITAEPEARLDSFMETKVVTVQPGAEAEEAARLISRYNILALPVVDGEGRLLGVITIDDAMDLILPEEWRGRLPQRY